MTYTKQSFAEARQNLRPEAFEWLNQVFLKGFYQDGDEATYRGFRLLAIDGSVIELPNAPALRAEYGVATNQSARGSVARARSSSARLWPTSSLLVPPPVRSQASIPRPSYENRSRLLG